MSAPAFVYVAPARFEDILKIGFSHDPCDRVRSFHARWFEYFELERGFVIAATDEQDARRIERLFAADLRAHRAHAPLVIARGPGGVTEWYRGAHASARALAEQIVAGDGYAPLAAFAQTMQARLLCEREDLFERSSVLLDAIDAWRGTAQGAAFGKTLRDLLDAYAAYRIDVREFVPADVLNWRAQAMIE